MTVSAINIINFISKQAFKLTKELNSKKLKIFNYLITNSAYLIF